MKRSIADLGKSASTAADDMRAAGQLAFAQSIVKMRDDFERTKAGPQWRAMEKMEAALQTMRADPEINVSEACTDLLDTVIELLDRAWPHHSIEDIVHPLQKHFDHIKSAEAVSARYAKDPKQAARDIVKQQWVTWQNNPADYEGKADFARDMQAQFPILKNTRSITRWCVGWERGED